MTITLVPLHIDHLRHIMLWVNDPEVMGYFADHQKPVDKWEEAAYIEKITRSTTDMVWSVFDGDMYLGQCSINQIYWPARNGRIFMALTRAQHGKGYAGQILEALKEKARAETLHKLWLIVREENVKSQAKYVKAGFAVEGVLRDEYFVQGRFHNMVRMAVIL